MKFSNFIPIFFFAPEIYLKHFVYFQHFLISESRVFSKYKLDIDIFKISSIENWWILLHGKRAMSDLFRVKIFFRCKRIVLCCVKRSQFSAIDRCCLEKFHTHPQKHSVKQRTVNKICKIILVPRMSVPKNIDSYIDCNLHNHFLSSLSINYFITI